MPPFSGATQWIVRAAFPCGNIYMQVADCLGNLYHAARPRQTTRHSVDRMHHGQGSKALTRSGARRPPRPWTVDGAESALTAPGGQVMVD
jgi:hypothetical protein